MRAGTAVLLFICALATFSLAASVDATDQAYLITTCAELQNMSADLTGSYTLANNIDCTYDTQNPSGTLYNGGAGFVPIGSYPTPFSGTFNGNNYTITGLYINQPSQSYVGLFGYTKGASISDVGLVNVNINGVYHVGGLIGSSYTSTINNSYSTGNVNGDQSIGGLIGYSDGSSIFNSYSTGNVTGIESGIGGLIGFSYTSTISNSYSTGNVMGNSYVGGLIGYSMSVIISNSYSTGNVNGSYDGVGGLIGESYHSNISSSYSTGNVNGSQWVGGLIGSSDGSSIFNSYSTGNVNGYDDVGGLIGSSIYNLLSSAYSTGNVNGSQRVGGLIGSSIYNLLSSAYSTGNVNGDQSIGGLIGYSLSVIISNSYSTGNVNGNYEVGGFIGASYSDTISNSFWDIYRSGQSACIGSGTPGGCTGVNSDGSQPSYFYDPSNPPMSSWDFTNIWQANPDAYPTLRPFSTPSDTTPPIWSDNTFSIPAIYSSSTQSYFNTTWTDNVGVTSVLFESNYSGAATNYTMPLLSGQVYGYSVVLPAGTFYWKTYASDAKSNTNISPAVVFTIAQATDNSALLINGSASDYVQSVTFDANITCTDTISGNHTLYQNGTALSSSIGTAVTFTQAYSAAGYYNITCVLVGHQNYTGQTSLYINATFTDTIPPAWSDSASSIPATYASSTQSYFNTTWTDNVGVTSVLLESNYSGTPTNYTMNGIGAGTYNYSAVLPAGTFYWKTYASDAQGNANMSPSVTFSIAQAAASPVLLINSSASDFTQNVSFRANLSCSDAISGNHTLYQNGTALSSSIGTMVTFTQAYSAAGYYNITCALLNDQNYAGQTALFITARKAAYNTSSFPRLFKYRSQKNANLASALSSISASFKSKGVNMTPELLAATMATLDKEVGGSYLPVEEGGDYGMGPGCTYKVKGRCRSTPYDGGVDYKGRGYIQITHKYNYATYCGPECVGTSTNASDICGCKNRWHCSVTDMLVCPQVRALQPQYAGRIFASYYVGNGLVSLSQNKSYYAVGLRINGGIAYANDFQKIANSYVVMFAKNPVQTQALVAWLNS